MDNKSAEYVRTLRTDHQLSDFADRLLKWLIEDQEGNGEETGDFSENRARVVLITAFVDDATLNDFYRLMENEIRVRIGIYDLLSDSGLAADSGMDPLIAASASQRQESESTEPAKTSWLALIVAAYSWKSGYPLYQLDPGAPPEQNTPAGQVLKRAVHLIRRQVTRTATEKDRLSRELNLPPSAVPTLDSMAPATEEIAPLPPHFRPPVPESYPETTPESLNIEPEEIPSVSSVEIGDPLVISADEFRNDVAPGEPIRMPPISIDSDQIAAEPAPPPSPLPPNAVVMPTSTTQSRPGFSMAIRQMFRQEEMATVKLRVLVQEYPDGPGLYGLQVRVTSKGIKSYVAGTTDREGRFTCELPVRVHSGLTYDIHVTWPRDVGGDVERKSITLNSDRTLFTIPFYRQISAPEL